MKDLCDKLLKLYGDKNVNEIIGDLINLKQLTKPNYNKPLNNKKNLNEFIELLTKANINRKKEVEELIDVLYKIGHCKSTFKDFTLTLDDFIIDKEIMDEYFNKVHSTISTVTKYNILQNYFNKAYNNLKSKNSRLIKIIESGLRANHNQLQQIIIGRGIIDTGLKKHFIEGNYVKGLTVDEFIKSSEGARKSIFDKTISTAKPGYLTRQLIYILQPYKFTEDDCGSNTYLKLPYKKFGKEWFIDKYYLNPSTGKLELFTIDTEYNLDYILIRSVLHCKSKNICKKCFGNVYFDYSQIGLITAQTLGERGTQLTLRAFHTGSAYDIPYHVLETINQLKDYLQISQTQELILTKDCKIEIPPNLILLKNNTILTDIDILIDNNKLTLTTGMKLFISESKEYSKNTIIAKLDVSSINNVITVLEALLRKRIVFNNINSLLQYIEILRQLFSYGGIFHLGMIELLVKATLDKNTLEFPIQKLPIGLIPHIRGYGSTFEKARTALIYNILNKNNDNLSEKYDLFKYTDIKGVGYYIVNDLYKE